jgi:CRISPR/Cas system-associated protein Cas10 (large subunit of type III CRISPR-Cas system)
MLTSDLINHLLEEYTLTWSNVISALYGEFKEEKLHECV